MKKGSHNSTPRIENRKAHHDYFIESKLECGIQLLGSEVKSLRDGLAQIAEAYASVENNELILHNCHIEPYRLAAPVFNHEPRRPRKLLAHKREIKALAEESERGGMTLIPLSIYFKEGRAKIEIGVARGKKSHDKRQALKEKVSQRELRQAMMKRQ